MTKKIIKNTPPESDDSRNPTLAPDSSPEMASDSGIQPNAFQLRVLQVPEQHDIFLGGGRGGSKTYAMILVSVQAIILHGSKFRGLFLRQSFPALSDALSIMREVFGQAFGDSASYSSNTHKWTFENSASLELGFLGTEADYIRYQGRSFSHLFIDELTQWATPTLLDMMLSNLRGTKGTPARKVAAGNPGSVGHQWVARRYALTATPGEISECPDSGRTFVSLPSTLEDNTFIDQDRYRASLLAATVTDPELGAAWIEGSWAILRGCYFADVLSELRSATDSWDPSFFAPNWSPDPAAREVGGHTWRRFLSMDWGSSAPCVVYVVAESPGGKGPNGRFYPRGSFIFLEEISTHDPLNPAVGLRWSVTRVADACKSACQKWGINAGYGNVADDAIDQDHGLGSISSEFRLCGVGFSPAGKKSRVGGWEVVKRLMLDAGKLDRPGFYASRDCRMLWETAPVLPRCPRNPDDVDSRSLDHWMDAAKYAVIARVGEVTSGTTRDLFARRNRL